MVDVNSYTLLRVNQKLNTFWGKECPGREGYWLMAQGYLDASAAWRTTGVVLPDWVSTYQSGVVVMYSKAGTEAEAMAPLLPSSLFYSWGLSSFNLTSSYACMVARSHKFGHLALQIMPLNIQSLQVKWFKKYAYCCGDLEICPSAEGRALALSIQFMLCINYLLHMWYD